MDSRSSSIAAIGWVLFVSSSLFAQAPGVGQAGVSYPDSSPPRGVSPNGAYGFDKLETVNKATGNLTYTIPLTSMPLGRAGLTLPVNLTYNSAQYDYSYSYTYGTQSPYPPFLYQTLAGDIFGGWSITPGYSIYLESKPQPQSNGNSCGSAIGQVRSSLVMPDGSRHVLYFPGFPQGFTGSGDGYFPWFYSGQTSCTQYSALAGDVHTFTADGSYITGLYSAATGTFTATLPNGTTITFNPSGTQIVADRNGNKITIANSLSGSNYYTTISDDIGRQIRIQNGTSGGWVVTQTGYNGASLTWTLSGYTGGSAFSFSYTCQTNQSSAGQSVSTKTCQTTGGGGTSNTLQVPSNDPNTPLVYTFQYGALSGLLQTVTLPSGASTNYSYQCNNYPSCFNNRTDLLNPVVSKARTWTDPADGTVRTETWNFGGSGYSYAQTFAKTNPDHGIETTYLGGIYMPVPVKVVEPNGDSTDYFYGLNRPYGVAYGSPNPYVRAQVHNLTHSGAPSISSQTSYQYDKNGNQLTASIYDWAAYSSSNRDSNGVLTALPTAAGTLLQTTQTGYMVTTAQQAGSGTEQVNDDAGGYWNGASTLLLHFPASSAITGTGVGSLTAYTYYGNANPHAISRWDSNLSPSRPQASSLSSSNASVISWSWDSYGNLTSETDPKGNITNYTYDGNSLYLAQKVQAAGTSVQRTFTYGWDQYFGLVTAKNDVDNSLTTNYAYDAIGRAIKVTEGAGSAVRQTNTTYSDANRTITVKHDQTASGDGVLTNVTTYDPLYRVALTQQLEGSGDTSGIKVQTRYQYSGNNSYKLISNPFRTSGDSTMGWTALTYDQNGRFISSQSFSGSSLPAPWGNNATSSGAVTTSYDAQNTTINDQAGSRRLTSTDGLGRLGSVTEYPGTGSWTTSYAYDALSDLKSVNQSGLARTFLYDSLQRLVASTNPENSSAGSPPALGCINGAAPYANCYYYDSNGNLTQKVDNRGIGTKYAYDPLNRLLRKTYFNLSGSVNYQGAGYTYDASSVPYARGRLTSTATMAGAYLNANDTSVTNYLGYDALGRVTGSNQVMNGATYPFSYSYNLADGLTSENYPSGRVVTTCYDGANRQSQVLLKGSCSTSSGTPYVSNVTYAAQGVETQYLLGSNITRNLPYNARLQLSGFADALGNSPLVNATLNWGTTNNNGNLQSAVYTHSGQGYSTPVSFTESFSYDGVNRLTSASDSGGWSRGFSYDAYGNMTPSGNPAPPPVSFNTNNQIVSQSYDQAGNQLSVNGNTVAYNSENLVMSETDGVTRAVETHAYDADGRRVKKYGPAGTTVFLYDALGRMAMEVSSAVSAPTCLTCYFSTDHLGSTRLITDRLGTVVARHDFMPFGEEVGSNSFGRNNQFGAGNDTINQKFTAKERDSESGLDYFGARYYGSALGRFTSPDPTFLNIRKVFNPQRWNLYGYGVDNPLKFVDPDGNESVAVYYPGYQVGVHGNFTLPLGHAGVVVVDKNGSTHYFEYGRYAPAGAGGDVAQGITRTVNTPSVQRDASGTITPDSMSALLASLSNSSGKHGDVDAVVLNTTDAEDAAIEAYLEGRAAENSDPNRQHYSIGNAHNCGTLICDALGAAGRKAPTAHSWQDPSGVFDQFLFWPGLYGVKQVDSFKPKVTSKFCYTDPSTGKTVCQ